MGTLMNGSVWQGTTFTCQEEEDFAEQYFGRKCSL
jgi:hypothetical protein